MSELPEGWAEASIDEVTEPVEVTKKGEPDRDILYVDISSIDNKRNVIEEPKRLRLAEAPSRARQKIKTGDVLFSTVRPYLRNIAQVPSALDGQIASTGFAVLRASEGIDPNFLFHWCVSNEFVSALTGEQYGVSYPAVKEEQVRSRPISLPPLNEQRRIVAKIEALFSRLEEGVSALKAARARLALYRQSLLKAAFEGRLTEAWRRENPHLIEPPETLLARIRSEREAAHRQALADWQQAVTRWQAEGGKCKKPRKPGKPREFPTDFRDLQITLPPLPHGWAWGRLGLCTIGVEYGTSAKSTDSGRVPVLRMGNLQAGKIDWSDLVYTSDEKEIARYRLRRGDVLFNRTNSPELVGKTAIVEAEREAIFAGYLVRVNQIESIVSGKYLNYFLNSDLASRHGNTVKTDGVNQSNINGNKLQEYPFPFCSPAEQAEIVRILEERLSRADALGSEIDAALARADALRQAILKRAFSGRLVPQDPADEPATTLLTRLRAERENQPKRTRRKVKA